ncbi:MAG: IS200/IS605 family transposase [Candidatus Cryptobacteroides sp.]
MPQEHHGRGYVYSLQYHIVFCTKYRRKVLQNGVDETCKYILRELSESMKFTIFAMEVMPDHIHLLVDVKPSFRIPEAMQKIKGSMSRALFVMHPEIKQKLWGGHLWNPTYCIVTVSNRSLQIVERYIANQKLK